MSKLTDRQLILRASREQSTLLDAIQDAQDRLRKSRETLSKHYIPETDIEATEQITLSEEIIRSSMARLPPEYQQLADKLNAASEKAWIKS